MMVQIRDVPDEVVAELKARAARERLSLSDYLKARLEEMVAEPTLDEVLDRLGQGPRRELRTPVTEVLDEVRSG
jgi:plasmid stability protein